MKNLEYDLVCVGGGIMSATLALLCKILKPDLNILILERLGDVAKESSASWNNAGTGHSALCELNYTPEDKDGNIDILKAIKICGQFEMSKQFWAYLVTEKLIQDPSTFITKCPHHSFVTGKKNVLYLKKRFKAMKKHFMFDSIQFTTEFEIMKEWFPLILEGRDKKDVIAASRIDRGTEMNFGSLTEQLYKILETTYNTKVLCNKEAIDVDPYSDEDWCVKVKDILTKEKTFVAAKHVFIGAGGGSLPLLEKVEIDEKDGYGGFPISGEWLVCKNEKIINQHFAKVYSMAELGS
ncbi:MAG: FAD-dependent oxidoreductase, partial [Flavobacteriaceae bacterium]|nr:FAD-dependent oxidoreductase [Flavobacteriaceae bacterium]